MDQQRIGSANILPGSQDVVTIKRRGKNVVAVLKYCVSAGGKVTSTKILKKSGYVNYDAKLKKDAKRWKFRPFKVGGKPTAVCSTTTFKVNPDKIR